MKRSGSAALAARCITEKANCPMRVPLLPGPCAGRPVSGEALRAALMPRQRAHWPYWPRCWTTSTAAWSLLWKQRLGNLKSSWVTSALLLFSSPFSHPRRPFSPLDSWQALAEALPRTRRRSLPWTPLAGKPLPYHHRPFAATTPPAALAPSRPAASPASILSPTSVELRGCLLRASSDWN